LRIAGRQGLVWEWQFHSGETLDYDLLDLDGVPLEDGSYTYEWRVAISAPDLEDTSVVKVQGGRFQVQEGVAHSQVKPVSEEEFSFLTNTKGNHFVGNLTTDSDLCAGCIDGASADASTAGARIRSKGLNAGIIIDEDSPDEYWMLGSSFGDFHLSDLMSGTETTTNTPFTIEDRAPSDSLYVASSGYLGLGTTVPQGNIHIVNNFSLPNIVFEYGRKTYAMAGNDVGWGVFDVTAGGLVRLMIEADTGDVCVGNPVPCHSTDAPLHVASSDGSAKLLVEEQSGTTAVRTQFQLWNNGAPRFALRNSNSGIEWSFQQSGPGNFLISKEGTGGPEVQVYQGGRVRMGPAGAVNFDLDPSGNLKIAGSLIANGSTFPDYVFETDYDLISLSDLRTYIQRQKRLPNIPSAEEVKKQGGHNMTELQLKLLEKIEELTLYTLVQDARLQEQGEKLQEMEALKARLAEIEVMLSDR
jgi:hypothetical protein